MSKPRRPKSKFAHVFDVYKAKDGWRWRLWSRNGRIVANGGEKFTSKAAAAMACCRIQDMAGSTIFVAGQELV